MVFCHPAKCILHLLHGIAQVGKLFQRLLLPVLQQMPNIQGVVGLPILFGVPQWNVQLQAHYQEEEGE